MCWIECQCELSIYAHYFYISPMCLYMPTMFRYAQCVLICPLFLDMPTVFRYAHCLYIYSLSLHMLTIEIYAHCLYICSLSLHMLIVFTYAVKKNPNPDSLYLFEQHSSVCVYIIWMSLNMSLGSCPRLLDNMSCIESLVCWKKSLSVLLNNCCHLPKL